MKILRLLLFEDCNRNCAGCCNKDWDLKALPVCKSFSGFDMIILTGGEPMLRPEVIRETVQRIRRANKCPIYLYTAKVDDTLRSLGVLGLVDGMTVTLHTSSDRKAFIRFSGAIPQHLRTKSLRLNIFEEVGQVETDLSFWEVKEQIQWLKNCPLPKNEVFMRREK